MKTAPRVLLESPYASTDPDTLTRNINYARAALTDSINRGEHPFASHLLYTQVLDDTDPLERETGIEAGLNWGYNATLVAVYADLGVTPGMARSIERAAYHNIPLRFRYLN